MPEAAPRPPQVTVAAWLVMAGSVVVVVTAFDQVAGLHTLETRRAVEEFLDDDLGRSLGLDVQGTLTAMRVLSMVAAACATAAAPLGYQVLKRSRPARLVLTILAGPLFLAGIVVGGLIPAMVVGSIAMLWFQPARDWVDGKTPRPAPVAPARPSLPPLPPLPPAMPPSVPTGSEPRLVEGYGDRASLLASLPPPSPRRPPALVWACVLAWVGAGLGFLVMLTTVVVVVADPDLLVDEILRQNPSLESDGLSAESLRSTVLFAGSLLLLWSLAAIVLAAYAWARRPWAWTGLLVSSASSAVLCLLGAVTSPLLIVPLTLCAVATALLLRPEVRAFIHR